jgi:sister-chromatid-cohesion protein PDS5
MLESISPRKRKKSLSSKLKITESDWALTDVERSRSAGGGDSKLKSASGSMKKRKKRVRTGEGAELYLPLMFISVTLW